MAHPHDPRCSTQLLGVDQAAPGSERSVVILDEASYSALLARSRDEGAADERARLEAALVEAYMLVYHAWNTSRFGECQSDEAKELRREMNGVLARAGVQCPMFRDNHPEILPPWAYAAEEERARIRQMALDLAAKYERYSEAADSGAEEHLYAELSDRFESFAALLEDR